jgi:chromosome segregation ATPase
MSLSACAHVYQAPSNAKLEASTKRLSNAVTKATNTAERARAQVDAARKAADKEATSSATVLTQLDELWEVLPPELKAKGDALKAAVRRDQADIGEIVTHVDGAQREHAQLGKDLFEANAAKLQVEVDKQEYYENADKLAAIATKDSAALAWYRRHWWGAWIVSGLGLIVLGLIAFLKFTGRLTLAGAKAYVGIKP